MAEIEKIHVPETAADSQGGSETGRTTQVVKSVIDNGDRQQLLSDRREVLKLIFSERALEGEDYETDLQVLQPEFVSYTDDEVLTVRIPVKKWMGNGLNVVQGGIMSYMFDAVVGPMAFAYSETDLSGTIDLSTSYLRPVLPTDPYVTIEARVRSNTRRMVYIEAELYDCRGKLCTTAVTNIMKGHKAKE